MTGARRVGKTALLRSMAEGSDSVGILKLYSFSQREKAGRPFAGGIDLSIEGLMARARARRGA